MFLRVFYIFRVIFKIKKQLKTNKYLRKQLTFFATVYSRQHPHPTSPLHRGRSNAHPSQGVTSPLLCEGEGEGGVKTKAKN
jgi:hypothetical protein